MPKITLIALLCLLSLNGCGIGHYIPVTTSIVQDAIPTPLTQRYARDIEDFPLYGGFKLVTDSHSLYTSSDGRIVTSKYFRRNIDLETVAKYYKDLLPALGWKSTSDTMYHREKEQLDLYIGAYEDGVLLSLQLKPLQP
jgi:hypothetical protein